MTRKAGALERALRQMLFVHDVMDFIPEKLNSANEFFDDITEYVLLAVVVVAVVLVFHHGCVDAEQKTIIIAEPKAK